MPLDEAPIGVQDVVVAQMVECAPVANADAPAPVVTGLEVSPVAASMAATIEQTGADPPPLRTR